MNTASINLFSIFGPVILRSIVLDNLCTVRTVFCAIRTQFIFMVLLQNQYFCLFNEFCDQRDDACKDLINPVTFNLWPIKITDSSRSLLLYLCLFVSAIYKVGYFICLSEFTILFSLPLRHRNLQERDLL